MAFTLEQESALQALLNEKRTTLSALSAATEVSGDDLVLINQRLGDKSATAEVLKQFVSPMASKMEAGIVRLSSALDSDSEITAATSKAAKVAYELAESRVASVNSKTGAVTVSAADVGAITQDDADSRYLRLADAPIFTVLYPGGSAEQPPTLGINQRIVVDNPFGHNVPVIAIAEIYLLGSWFNPHYSAHHFNNIRYRYGVGCTQVNNSIVVVSAQEAIFNSAFLPNFVNQTTSATSLPYRIKVWRAAR